MHDLRIPAGNRAAINDAANLYGTSGTGGVGVAGNDTYGQGYMRYLSLGTSTNYIAAQPHPSAAYGDLNINPVYVDINRRIAVFDALPGGPGTDLHFAQEMAARCGLTAATGVAGGLTYNPAYTPQALYQFLTAGFAPTNISLTGVGAQTPVLVGAW